VRKGGEGAGKVRRAMRWSMGSTFRRALDVTQCVPLGSPLAVPVLVEKLSHSVSSRPKRQRMSSARVLFAVWGG
jgi:hypothetical protein